MKASERKPGQCSWILTGWGPNGEEPEVCGKTSGYRMVEDGGEPGAPKVRKYHSLCPPHQAKSDAQEDEEEL